MGQVVQMDAFRRKRNVVALSRIEELERTVAYWDRILRTSPDVHTREQAAIRGGQIKIEIGEIKSQLGIK